MLLIASVLAMTNSQTAATGASGGCEASVVAAGMICIAADEPTSSESFLIDRDEASVEDYSACRKAKVCSPTTSRTELTRAQVHRFCVWAGKRGPTDAEWLRARPTVVPNHAERSPGLRCATNVSVLYRPPYWHASRRSSPGPLSKPTPEALELFQNIRHDDAVKQLETCERGGRAGHACRDPTSYILSNEGRRGNFARYIANLGCG